MMRNYIVYPEAVKTLEECGLAERVRNAASDDDFPCASLFTIVLPEDFRGFVTEMGEGGYFKTQPAEGRDGYRKSLDGFGNHIEQHTWVVRKHIEERAHSEPEERKLVERIQCEPEDFLLLSGYLASRVLKPDELWDFEMFGFSSLFEFFGTLGAYIWSSGEDLESGYTWVSEHQGSSFASAVTASHNGDLRIFRTDTTPYDTVDPFGCPVQYCPKIESDRGVVSGYHSTEPHLLAFILLYVDQNGVKSSIANPNGSRVFLEEVAALGQVRGNFSDFGDSINSPRFCFALGSLPRLDEASTSTEWSPYRIATEMGGEYVMYVDHTGSLAFTYETVAKIPEKKVSMTIPPDEVDHLIRGLFVQAAHGLGRTSVAQLTDVLQYRFSDEFEQDQAQMRSDRS